MEKKKFGFGFRYEKNLAKILREFCSRRRISINTLVEAAFQLATKLHSEQKLSFRMKSGFLKRSKKPDKVETVLLLRTHLHEDIRKYAIVYRRSMAEIIRISLEIFLDDQKNHRKQPVRRTLYPIIRQIRIILTPFRSHYRNPATDFL